jgi:hypothetical protein
VGGQCHAAILTAERADAISRHGWEQHEEFGYFQFGGSDIILLFQERVDSQVDTNAGPPGRPRSCQHIALAACTSLSVRRATSLNSSVLVVSLQRSSEPLQCLAFPQLRVGGDHRPPPSGVAAAGAPAIPSAKGALRQPGAFRDLDHRRVLVAPLREKFEGGDDESF